MPAELILTHFTDPACPFAFSAEPSRLAIEWAYGDRVAVDDVMVGLAENEQSQIDKGLSTELLAEGAAKLAEEHGMPIDATERDRLTGSVAACRAVVAARLRAPSDAGLLLRALRVRNFRGQHLDEPATLRDAASDAGIDPDELERWLADEAVERELREDMDRARRPSEAALALDDKLAGWEGGRRYTCPSYELSWRSGQRTASAPGFQPWSVYDVALANVAPELERRPAPESVEELLNWAPHPLASAEVARLLGCSIREARQRLAKVAAEDPVGGEGYWSIPG